MCCLGQRRREATVAPASPTSSTPARKTSRVPTERPSWASAARTSKPPGSCCAKPLSIRHAARRAVAPAGRGDHRIVPAAAGRSAGRRGLSTWTTASRSARSATARSILRSFGDDLKALLRAYQEEQRLGREHPEWLAWCRALCAIGCSRSSSRRRLSRARGSPAPARWSRPHPIPATTRCRCWCCSTESHRRPASTSLPPSALPISAGRTASRTAVSWAARSTIPTCSTRRPPRCRSRRISHLFAGDTATPRWLDACRRRRRFRRDLDLPSGTFPCPRTTTTPGCTGNAEYPPSACN